MPMRILVGNEQTQWLQTEQFEKTIHDVVAEVGKQFSLPDKTEISITLTDDEQIRELNSSYRGLESPTDVLSFAFDEETPDEKGLPWPSLAGDGYHLLGEIVISLERAIAQAQEYGHSPSRELGFLAAHGMLHLLGFTHDQEEDTGKMREWEEKILLSLDLPRD